MEVNFKDYLTELEIKEIIKEEFKYIIREQLKDDKNITRIISNAPYYKLYEVVDENLPADYKDTIKNKVSELINDLKSYNVFRYNYSDYRKSESVASDILELTVKENENLIKDNVQRVINNSDNIYDKFIDNFLSTIDNGFTININKGEK